jgi:hypothetical protein
MKKIKRLNEFFAAEPAVKPTTAPPTTRPGTPTRPARPIPTKRPGEKEKEKPMAQLGKVLDLFFTELKKIKNTPEGAKMIKKLHNKYA